MSDTRRTLDAIFGEARNEPTVTTIDEVQRLLASTGSVREALSTPPTSWRTGAIVAAVIAVCLMVVMIILTGDNGRTASDTRADRAVLKGRKIGAHGAAAARRAPIDSVMTHIPETALAEARVDAVDNASSPRGGRRMFDTAAAIVGMPLIVLDEAGMDSLGIRVAADGTIMYAAREADDTSALISRIAPENRISAGRVALAAAPRLMSEELLPAIVTDAVGLRIGRPDQPGDRDIERLLPVQVRAGGNSNATTAVFWYRPRPALLRLLPDSILLRLSLDATSALLELEDNNADTARRDFAESLRTSVDSIISAKVLDGTMVPRRAVPRAGGAFLGIGGSESGAVSVSPMKLRAGMKRTYAFHLILKEARVISMSLYDISGGRVLGFGSATKMGAGDYELNVIVKDSIQPGMYLFGVMTGNGERAVQRLSVAE